MVKVAMSVIVWSCFFFCDSNLFDKSKTLNRYLFALSAKTVCVMNCIIIKRGPKARIQLKLMPHLMKNIHT